MTCEGISRRGMLYGGMSLAAWSALPVMPSLAGSRDPRLLIVVLRGALDGLAAVMPTGDPDFLNRRGAFAADMRGAGEGMRLDGMFTLSPAMPKLARLYVAGDAALVHAVATSYRERSHFDGQDVLESGLPSVARADSGWLNRVIAQMPTGSQASKGPRKQEGLALGYRVPLIMRGKAPVLSWAPQALPQANDDTISRLLDIYDSDDPELAAALRKGVRLDAQLSDGGMVAGNDSGGMSAERMMSWTRYYVWPRHDGWGSPTRTPAQDCQADVAGGCPVAGQ